MHFILNIHKKHDSMILLMESSHLQQPLHFYIILVCYVYLHHIL
jgi:hypothetical protein